MSGQCLSPSGGGHALTPPRRLRLGGPLPRQLPGTTSAAPRAESHLCSEEVIRYYRQFPAAIPDPWARTDALLPRSPLSGVLRPLLARLACLIHATNVHSEPGSNPSRDRLGHRPKPAPERAIEERAPPGPVCQALIARGRNLEAEDSCRGPDVAARDATPGGITPGRSHIKLVV